MNGAETVAYGHWTISYNPPPIPSRKCDWQFCHNDFDGAEDACDNRYGSAASLLDAMNEIDDAEDEAFVCLNCRVADPACCMLAQPCAHRFDRMLRQKQRDSALCEAA